MTTNSSNPAQDWASIVSPTALNQSLRVLAPAGARPLARQASSGAYSAGVDYTGVARRQGRNAIDGPQNRLIAQLLYDNGIAVASTAQLLLALQEGARVIRVCPGTYTLEAQIALATYDLSVLTLIVSGGDDVAWTIDAGLADALFDLGAAGLLNIFVEDGSSFTVTDARTGGVFLTTADGTGASGISVYAPGSAFFRYEHDNADGVFAEVTALDGGNARVAMNLLGAQIALQGGVATANAGSHLVALPAGAGTDSGAVGSIIRCRLEVGTLRHTTAAGVAPFAGDFIEDSVIVFSRICVVLGLIDTTVTGAVVAAAATEPTGLATFGAFGPLVRSAVNITYSGGGFAAPFTLAFFGAVRATNFSLTATGDAGQDATVINQGASSWASVTFDFTGFVNNADVLFDGTEGLVGDDVSFFGAAGAAGLRDVEFSSGTPDVIKLSNIYIDGCREARFSDVPQNVRVNGANGPASQVVRAINGLLGLDVFGAGANQVDVTNEVANFTVAPWTGGVRYKVYDTIRNAMSAGDVTLEGAFFFQVTNVFLLNGALGVGGVTPFDFLFLDNIVAASVNAVGDTIGDSGFYGNVAGTRTGSFFAASATATTDIQAAGTVRSFTAAAVATGLPFPVAEG